MIDKNQVLLLAEERVNELNKGLYIVDLTISPTNSIYVEIDNENGPVAIADCISISRNIEHSLDRESMDFELQVSSAGLDRPLKHEKQFKKIFNSAKKLQGKQVMAVVNFAPKQVGPIMSECLVLGFYRKDNSVVLATNDLPINNGSRLL